MHARIPLLLAALSACAGSKSREYFRPGERAAGESRLGYEQAVYDIEVNGERAGEAKVWSLGAYRGELDGTDRTLVHVGFELENGGTAPFVLAASAVQLAHVQTDDGPLHDVPAVSVRGPAAVRPEETAELDVYFALPAGVMPQEVDGYALRWALDVDGRRYHEWTPFVEDEELAAYAPMAPTWGMYRYYTPYFGRYPYYDLPPYWDDPFVDPVEVRPVDRRRGLRSQDRDVTSGPGRRVY